MKIRTLAIVFCTLMSVLILCSSCSNEETNEFAGTLWKAKIDMNSTILPIQINKNEQHYYKLSFTENEFAIDLVDSNGVTVLSDTYGNYHVINDILIVSSSTKAIQMWYYPEQRYIFISYYGENFYKQ